MKLSAVLLILFLIPAGFPKVSSLFKITNFKCESFNKSWAVFRECRLRAIKRGITALNMNVDFLYPAYKIDVNIDVLKKANGYKPFLYNITIDACAFIKKPNNPLASLIYNLFKEYTNINHTCPYVDQQIVSGFVLRPELLKLPLPNGEYALFLTWYLHSMKTFITNVYFAFEDKR